MSFLEVRNITKRFGSTVALDAFTVALAAGEFFSLLGPSGCGKTTALRIVAGFDRADLGSVVLNGVPITDLPPNLRGMGVVFQSYSLFPNMTARENIEFGLRVRRQRTADRMLKATQLLDLVGLSELGGRYPHQLSGGQQQRVAVARALAVEPRILLMDEPLSALDNQIRVQLREDLREIQARLGTTVLHVTHDQEEALSISDRVAVMSQGRIEQTGSPAEIYGEPATRVVAEFVGAMNRLEARVVDGRCGVVRHADAVLWIDDARGWQDGRHVVVLIRPELMSVDSLRDDQGPLTAFRGRVVARAFLGPSTRLKVKTAELGLIFVDVPSTTMQRFPVSTEVTVSFDTKDARVLAA